MTQYKIFKDNGKEYAIQQFELFMKENGNKIKAISFVSSNSFGLERLILIYEDIPVSTILDEPVVAA